MGEGTHTAAATRELRMTVVNDRPQLRAVSPPGPTSRFDEVFRAAYRDMYGLAFRLLGDSGEAEDSAQEVFVKLAADPVLDRPDPELRAWLRRVTLNDASNRLRARNRAAHHIDRAGRLEPAVQHVAEPLTGVLRAEEQAAVRRALTALPPRQRDCLLLRHSGFSYAEIAATLQIALGSVGVLLTRAERAFRTTYENQENQP